LCPSVGRETLRTTCLIPGNAGFLSAASPTSSHRREKVGRFSLAAAAYDAPSRIASGACCAIGSVRRATSRCLRGPCRRRQARDDFGFALNQLGIRARLTLRKHLLDKLNRALQLLVRHRLDGAGMLNSRISRAQQCQQLAVSCRLVLAHLSNCRWTAVPEVSQQRRDELAIQLLTMTRADRRAGRVSFFFFLFCCWVRCYPPPPPPQRGVDGRGGVCPPDVIRGPVLVWVPKS
jgi:hypothetical protein